jgi:hypothetical protein
MQSTYNLILSTMKANFFRSLLVLFALTATGHAQTINWGSEVTLVDRTNNPMTNSFVYELGAFTSGFDPSSSPLLSWFANWHVFDTATYNATLGIFTGTAQMTDGGGSSDYPNPAFSFNTLPAYLWIRNQAAANASGSEWLVVHDLSWTFPTATLGCCDPALPLEWSVSDMSNVDVPKFGYQAGTVTVTPYREGQGTTTANPATGTTYLQTAFAPVPESSSSVLIVILGVLGLTDRRRTWQA